ncbi:HAD family hydrolase [Acidicapsa dinghuensis]|uniref:HAD family hydrolase n=1 Tax=Acidicapsa dinghuensis TaxID=2218256 RepID=A0ABW1EQI1_9BACT|nr:HAD family hydrolase [Acidicapsa dinghuensis]
MSSPSANLLKLTGQTLLIDADDTLWENNIYFERAIAAYISYLDHLPHTPEQVRKTLNQVERETILSHGYGLTSFAQSLITCFERLTEVPIAAEHEGQIRSFAQSIADHEIELLPGVSELLPKLAERHRLILMTKGSQAEQADKLARSGLAPHFTGVEIVAEKNPAAYREVINRYGCEAGSTWMIGNSPKSDINPALAAGLHAVFIFHKDTWVLEHAELSTAPDGQKLLEVDSFRGLAKIF